VLANGCQGSQTYYLHALSLTTLADLVPPEEISASAPLRGGRTYRFNASVSRQRAALLLANGNIYAGFASFCDVSADQSRGWVLGWNQNTLSPLAANKLNNQLASSPHDFFLSSVWMSGYGFAANSAGSILFVTGNSDYSGSTFSSKYNITESAAEMSGDLTTLEGLFTPSNWRQLDKWDSDFGSGGLMLMPTQPGEFPDLAVAAGKFGEMYVLDADNLKTKLFAQKIDECWCGPSYYQGSDGSGHIVASGGNTVRVFENQGNAEPDFAQVSEFDGIAGRQNPGFFTSVSSNGTKAGSAIVWAVGRPADNTLANIDLYAVNPDNGNLLFHSVAGRWLNTNGDSNTVPLVANGLVYVATDQMLTIFGRGAKGNVGLPKIRPAMRTALAPGEHEIYGTVANIRGNSLLVKTRGGEAVRVKTISAMRAHDYAPPMVGRALIARGKFDGAGVLEANAILHAVSHPAMWPADR
jgi:hypothetical protein